MKAWIKKSLFWLHIFVLCGAVGTLFYIWSGDTIITIDSRRAYEQCEKEVAKGCPLLYEYSTIIEKENEKLTFIAKECARLNGITVPPTDTGR